MTSFLPYAASRSAFSTGVLSQESAKKATKWTCFLKVSLYTPFLFVLISNCLRQRSFKGKTPFTKYCRCSQTGTFRIEVRNLKSLAKSAGLSYLLHQTTTWENSPEAPSPIPSSNDFASDIRPYLPPSLLSEMR